MSMFGWVSNLPYFGSSSKLCNACQDGDLKVVKELSTPELINSLGWMGWAPLHKAAQAGHTTIVEFFLTTIDLKADVNIRDTDNHTPLILACGLPKEATTDRHSKVIHLLLAGGANVNAEDDGGYSALDLAVINNNLEAVKLLLEYKANPSHRNQDGFTPLHSACRYGLQDIASLLVSAGADLSISDGQGRTPVQLAQRYGVVLSLSSPKASNALSSGPTTTTSSLAATSSSNQHASGIVSSPSHIPVTTTYSSADSAEEIIKSLQAELEAEIRDNGEAAGDIILPNEPRSEEVPAIATHSSPDSIKEINKSLQAEPEAEIGANGKTVEDMLLPNDE